MFLSKKEIVKYLFIGSSILFLFETLPICGKINYIKKL